MEIKKSLVSIILPCYNSEKTILQTLESIENQTYPNIEIIIVNDGSSDNTEDIVKKFMSMSKKKIHYIMQSNAGVSAARNKGIHSANGEYIVFLDSDDFYHYDAIRTLVYICVNENVDTVFGCYTRDTQIINQNKIRLNESSYISLNRDELLKKYLYRKEKIGFWTFLYKSEILKKFNILFSENVSYGEDVEFCWKYIMHCKAAAFINQATYIYNDNPESVVNNLTWNVTDSLISVLQTEKYIKTVDIDFYNTFRAYSYQREIWKLLKDFSVSKKKDLFYKFIEEYKIKKINVQIKSHGTLVFITSILFNINPTLFYYFIRMLVCSNIYRYLRK